MNSFIVGVLLARWCMLWWWLLVRGWFRVTAWLVFLLRDFGLMLVGSWVGAIRRGE